MNCIEFRRLLLAEPRARSKEQQAHVAQCEACAGFMKEIESLDSRIEEAILVPVPESLDERVLLRQKIRRPARFIPFALAASITLALGLGVIVYNERRTTSDPVVAGVTLGGENPAVAAISYVLDHEPQLLKENVSGDPAVMRSALMRLGMKLPAEGTTVRYLGKCPVPSGEGEHLVLQTPFGQVTLILVPEQSLGPRVVVAYRDRTAAVNPLRSGSYIVVADSLNHIKRMEKMLM